MLLEFVQDLSATVFSLAALVLALGLEAKRFFGS